jgi:WD repeat and SOF domain-containing protein 1
MGFPVPSKIGLTEPIVNPATSPQLVAIKSGYRSPGAEIVTEGRGVGPKRVYLDIQSQPPSVAYPPRPVPGSVADLDHVMKHCDFGTGKVRLLTNFLERLC